MASSNNNAEYWRKRFEILEDAQNNKGIEYFHDLERIYQNAANETEKEIAKWYRRYAKNEGITLAEAKKQLTNNELKEFRMSLQEYIEKGESLDPKWAKQLERASTKYHVTRLEALKLQMQQQVEYLMGQEADGVDNLLKNIYTDSYYRTAFEIQKGVGIGWDLMKLDQNLIDKTIVKPWTADGTNFSKRIWGKYRPELVKKLHDGLTQNLILGKSPDKLIDEIQKQFGVKKSQSENLVRTEKAYFMTVAQNDCFSNLGVEQYEVVATLDTKTSDICRSMDGKVFDMKDFAPGSTAPPFHNRCRTATAPYFNDEFDDMGERAARDKDGNYYTVPASMKYDDWHKAFVEGDKSGIKVEPIVPVVPPTTEVIEPQEPTYTIEQPKTFIQGKKDIMDNTEIIDEAIENVADSAKEVEPIDSIKRLTKDEAISKLKSMFNHVNIDELDKIDEKLFVENVSSLESLEKKYGIIKKMDCDFSIGHKAFNTYQGEDAVALFDDKAFMEDGVTKKYAIAINTKKYDDYYDMMKSHRNSVERGYTMDCLEKYDSVFALNHEYGHMLEAYISRNKYDSLLNEFKELENKRNELFELSKDMSIDVAERIKMMDKSFEIEEKLNPLKSKINNFFKNEEPKIHSEFRNEILEIAGKKLISQNPYYAELFEEIGSYDFVTGYMSSYGKTNPEEFFAEAFANSQCGKPNVIGEAMIEWLEKKLGA